MSRKSKIILSTAIIFLIYGYLCRILNVNFFWDSKTIGLIFLFIALLSYWIDVRKKRKQQGKKITWPTIGICFITLGLFALPIVVFKIKTSDAYQAATEYLESNPKIIEETGPVKGFGFIPTGSMAISTIDGVESGTATFKIIVRGTKKNKDVIIELKKTSDTFWSVIEVN